MVAPRHPRRSRSRHPSASPPGRSARRRRILAAGWQPSGITMLKLATWPKARPALKVDTPEAAVPAGMSLFRHSADGVAGDQRPPGPSMLPNRIGGFPVAQNPDSGHAVLLVQVPPEPVSHLAVPASSQTFHVSAAVASWWNRLPAFL